MTPVAVKINKGPVTKCINVQVIYNVNSMETGSENSSLAQVDHELTRDLADSDEDSQYRVHICTP